MAEIAKITVKTPRFRIALALAAIRLLAPFVRSEALQARICEGLVSWVQRGLRVYAGGRRL